MDAGAKRERARTPPERPGTQRSGNPGRLAKAVTANAQETPDSVPRERGGARRPELGGDFVPEGPGQDQRPPPAPAPMQAILVAAEVSKGRIPSRGPGQ